MRARFALTHLLAGLAALVLIASPSVARAADEEDEDAPAKPAGPVAPTPATPAPATPGTAAPVAPAKPAPVTPAPAAPASPNPAPIAPPPPTPTVSTPLAPAPRSDVPTFKLVGGAPLGDPNVNVHIMQRKALSDFGRHEVVFFPAVAQINGKFTNHLGVAAEYLYHFQENVAVQVTPMYYYVSNESQFNQDLINIAQLQAQAATALTMTWGLEAGIEATPIYGKFSFYQGNMAHFALVLNAGIGLADTHVQLRPGTSASAGEPAQSTTFGDTGYKFMGNVGGGFRVKFGEHWDVRLEVRDLVYSASVDTINGCNLSDLTQLEGGLPAGSSACQSTKFATVKDPTTGSKSQPDVVIAKDLIKTPSSDVLNQVEFFGGVAYIF